MKETTGDKAGRIVACVVLFCCSGLRGLDLAVDGGGPWSAILEMCLYAIAGLGVLMRMPLAALIPPVLGFGRLLTPSGINVWGLVGLSLPTVLWIALFVRMRKIYGVDAVASEETQ